ncbi:phage tail tape measure protein [Konateibacter massiliensis]|uniref:phage tail tape measure protein n=1 Tax=Konateibacter massiliensis TaxID=2002841 RepID=UPI000C1505E9|nr:phage tail tape measure protein [Konateibacter massiliensis]
MADKTENIKTRLSFDGEAEYKAACKEINSTLKVLNSEMKLVTAEYKDNASSADALKAKQGVLQKTYDEQAKKVKETEAALEKCKKATGDNSEASKKLETQLNYQKAALVKTEQELNKTADELGKAEKAADDMGKEIEESGEQAEQAGGKFSGLGGILGGLGGAMSKGIGLVGAAAAGIGAAVVAGLGYTVSQADEAKGALNDFVASTGTATDEADQYKQVMENIYNGNYGEGFEDIAASMATVKQQAGDMGADELEKMTTNALTLRDTFDMDVAESTRAATQLMQKFGVSGDEAYNLIAQGAQSGLNKNGDLLDVINEYSNQYAQAGLSAEDMFNSIKNGADTGVWSVDKMGDAFKEFSIRMNDGTANDYLTSLGLNAKELVGKFQAGGDGAKEAMSKISEALKNTDDTTLQYTAGVGLMGTMWEDMGADAMTSLMNVDGQISKTTDAMGAINAIKYDTFGEAMQGAGRILQTSFIMPIGEQALPIFSQFANELQTGAAEAGGDVGKLAESFGTALKNMVSGLTEMIPQIAQFAVEIVKGLGDGIVQNAPTIVQAGVDMLKSLTDGIIQTIPTLTQSAVEIITTLISGIVDLIPTIAEGAANIIVGLAEGMAQALPGLIPSIIEAVLMVVQTLIENAPLLINAGLELIKGLVQGLVNALPVLIAALPEIIKTYINYITEAVPLILENAAVIITALADGLIQAIPQLVEALPEIITAIVTGLAAAAPKILKASITLLGAMIKAIPEVKKSLDEAIPHIITGLVKGLVDGIPKVGQAILEIGKEILNGIKKFFGINSPSTVMAEQGGFLVAGMLNGIKELPAKAMQVISNMKDSILSITKTVPEAIANSVSDAVNKIATWGLNMLTKAKEVMNVMLTGIVAIVTQTPEKIWNSIIGAVTKVATWGGNMLEKAKEVMNTMLTGIVTIVTQTPEKIWNSIIGAVTKVATWGSNMLEKAKEVMNSMVTGIVTVVKEIPEKIYNSISGAISKVTTWGTEVKDKAVEGMKNCVTGIKDAFSNIGSDFKTIGGNIVSGIWDGISAGWDWLKDKVKSLASSLLDAAKDALDINSPSRKFRDEVGVYMAQGIGVGFSDEMENVNKQIEDAIPSEFDIGAKVNVSKDIDFDDGKNPKPKKGGGAGFTVIQNIYADTTDYAKQQKEAARQFKMIARTV